MCRSHSVSSFYSSCLMGVKPKTPDSFIACAVHDFRTHQSLTIAIAQPPAFPPANPPLALRSLQATSEQVSIVHCTLSPAKIYMHSGPTHKSINQTAIAHPLPDPTYRYVGRHLAPPLDLLAALPPNPTMRSQSYEF
jgi:hypothetical protein